MYTKGLLIDIDDTVLRTKTGVGVQDSGSLMRVFEKAGVELTGLSLKESTTRIKKITDNIKWWRWEDFINELGLDSNAFWEYAYNIEKEYLEATESDLTLKLFKLKKMGIKLFVTSNNPNSGICHKLRLAGVKLYQVDEIFTKLFGVPKFKSMKWDTKYWNSIIPETGLNISELAVVGDNILDDCEIPQSIGIPLTFLIDPKSEHVGKKNKKNMPVKNIGEIVTIFEQKLMECTI